MPGPSDKRPLEPESVVEVEHLVVGCANGTGVTDVTGVTGPATGAMVGAALAAGAGADEVYIASKPASFTDPSDEKSTVSGWPLGDVTVMPDRVPVMVAASCANDEAPLYTLTKS